MDIREKGFLGSVFKGPECIFFFGMIVLLEKRKVWRAGSIDKAAGYFFAAVVSLCFLPSAFVQIKSYAFVYRLIFIGKIIIVLIIWVEIFQGALVERHFYFGCSI